MLHPQQLPPLPPGRSAYCGMGQQGGQLGSFEVQQGQGVAVGAGAAAGAAQVMNDYWQALDGQEGTNWEQQQNPANGEGGAPAGGGVLLEAGGPARQKKRTGSRGGQEKRMERGKEHARKNEAAWQAHSQQHRW